GPDIDEYLNVYYLEWWTLVHFLVHRDGGTQVGDYFEMIDMAFAQLADFERIVGSIDEIESELKEYVKAADW
ncbi:MAG: hypothetical protein V2A73_18710, partial [Pseudomonadota bacterium]